MTHTYKRLLAVALAVSVALAAFAGGGAAAPSIDTEATDTTSTSEIQDGTTVANFSANGSKTSIVGLQAEQTTNDTRVQLWHNASDAMVAENDSGVFTGIDTTNGESYHNHSFDHDQLGDLERGINDNVTVSVRATNNTTVDNPDSAYIAEFYVETDDSVSVEYVSDSDVDTGDIVEVENESGTELPVVDMEIGGADSATLETNDRQVNDSTKVVVALGNGTVADDFDRVAEGTSSGEELSGIFGTRAVAIMETDDGTTAVPVFDESVPDDFDDSRTYALYESVGGTDAVVLYQGDDLDTDEIAVTAAADPGLLSYATDYISLGFNSLMGTVVVGGGALALGALPLAASRHEPRDWFRNGGA
jgi:hypothetical protein